MQTVVCMANWAHYSSGRNQETLTTSFWGYTHNGLTKNCNSDIFLRKVTPCQRAHTHTEYLNGRMSCLDEAKNTLKQLNTHVRDIKITLISFIKQTTFFCCSPFRVGSDTYNNTHAPTLQLVRNNTRLLISRKFLWLWRKVSHCQLDTKLHTLHTIHTTHTALLNVHLVNRFVSNFSAV